MLIAPGTPRRSGSETCVTFGQRAKRSVKACAHASASPPIRTEKGGTYIERDSARPSAVLRGERERGQARPRGQQRGRELEGPGPVEVEVGEGGGVGGGRDEEAGELVGFVVRAEAGEGGEGGEVREQGEGGVGVAPAAAVGEGEVEGCDGVQGDMVGGEGGEDRVDRDGREGDGEGFEGGGVGEGGGNPGREGGPFVCVGWLLEGDFEVSLRTSVSDLVGVVVRLACLLTWYAPTRSGGVESQTRLIQTCERSRGEGCRCSPA